MCLNQSEEALKSPQFVNKISKLREEFKLLGEKLKEVGDRDYGSISEDYGKKEKQLKVYDAYKKNIEEISWLSNFMSTVVAVDDRAEIERELSGLKEENKRLERQLLVWFFPESNLGSKGAMLELRAGVGGDEAARWAGDLLKMYEEFAKKKKWDFEILKSTLGVAGGFKEVIVSIKNSEAYRFLQKESGIHRVQRIPYTESQGRIHTSTVSVAVLPKMDDIDVVMNPKEIRKDTFCSSGPGGQSVNTTYSAVRLTHIPTGIVASCQDEKSQIKNYNKALSVLYFRIVSEKREKQDKIIRENRKSMVKSGDRSEKIRSYNFPNNRVIDHRIDGFKFNLAPVLRGNIGELIQKLQFEE